MYEQLLGVESRFVEIETRLSDPQVVQDRQAYEKYSREHAELSKVVGVFRDYKQVMKEMDDSLELLKDGDPEIKALARDEMASLEERKTALDYIYDEYNKFFDKIIIAGYENHKLIEKYVENKGYSIDLIKLDKVEDIGYTISYVLKSMN